MSSYSKIFVTTAFVDQTVRLIELTEDDKHFQSRSAERRFGYLSHPLANDQNALSFERKLSAAHPITTIAV
jgi:hypothetical protein